MQEAVYGTKTDHKRKFPLVCECCGADFMGHRASAQFCTKSCKGQSQTHTCRPLLERLMQYVQRPSDPDACWEWTGALRAGYGVLQEQGKVIGAHRIAYELFVGPIPQGLTIDHTCHNGDQSCKGGASCPHRSCVNPAHLEAVTGAVNTRRSPAVKANARRAQRIRWERTR